jgi:hypothetical protein
LFEPSYLNESKEHQFLAFNSPKEKDPLIPGILSDWEFFDPQSEEAKIERKRAIKEILVRYAKPFDDNVNELPNYRISKSYNLR